MRVCANERQRYRWPSSSAARWASVLGAFASGCSDSTTLLESPTGAADTRPVDPLSSDAPDAGDVPLTTSPNAGGAAGSAPASEPDASALTLRFVAKIGDQDFACGRTYTGQGSSDARVQPTDLRLFVQDIALVRGDGELVPLRLDDHPPWQTADVALLDFENGEGACLAGNPETNAVITGSVPAGEYRGLVFSNGVPEALNHGDPATLPAPLQAGGTSWGWLLGYKFVITELAQVIEASPEAPAADMGSSGGDAGVSDSDAGSSPTGLPGFGLLHLGSTACTGNPGTGSVRCARPNRNRIRLDDFQPDQDRVVIDVGAIFSATDLREDAQCHSAGEACAPLFEALGVRLDDGLPAETQRAYRVE